MNRLLIGLLLAVVAVGGSACAVVPLGYPGGQAVYAPGPAVVVVPGHHVVYGPHPRRWYW